MTGVSANYAQALYSLAKEDAITQEVLEQIEVLDKAFTMEPKFLKLLSTPTLNKEERCQLLDDSLRGNMHPYVLNFLKILTQKGYVRHFGDCVRQYRQIYNEDHGIVCVTVTTAVEMTDQQKEKLQNKLETVTGKTVYLQAKVNADCVGGVRLDYDGKRIDGTIKSRLDTLRSQLLESR